MGRRAAFCALMVACCASLVGADWPTYLATPSRSGTAADTGISASSAPQLTVRWTYKTGGTVAASATVVNSVVYVGSWDGYEYALNATTGALLWRTYLGVTTTSNCSPATTGITSSATVQNGVVYVGGGGNATGGTGAYWYALNASTGAMEWQVYTGDNSAAGGVYNWSSPLIDNGYAYIGVSSDCDSPLVQGKLLQVLLPSSAPSGDPTLTPAHEADLVPAGQVGASVWTSPTFDSATNTVYVTTGNGSGSGQPYAEAIVALDASTLAIKDSWQLPAAAQTTDSDWGTTPTLFSDSGNRQLVEALNKNGFAYAWNRSNLAAGPVWQDQVAAAGDCPECGNGSVSSSAFDGTTLYVSGGNTTINNQSASGFVRAVNPATGAYRWEHAAPLPVLPALAYDNGLVIDGAGSTLEVLDATSGAVRYSTQLNASIDAAPSVAEGEIIESTVNGTVYAFAPATGGSCFTGWSCADVGSPAIAGGQASSGSSWTISGAGNDVWGTSDQFHYVWQTVAGSNATVSAHITAQSNTNAWAKAGVMLRASSDPGSPFYAAFITPSHGIAVQYRAAQGGSAVMNANPAGTLPAYLQVSDSGGSFTASTSSDGNSWTPISGSAASISFGSPMLAGAAVTSHSASAASTMTVDSLSVTGSSTTAGCPAGYSCEDIGNPTPAGTQSRSGSPLTVQGGGGDIFESADHFHYVWQTLAGDGSFSARIASQSNSNAWAKAGVMLRASTDPGAPEYSLLLTPGHGIVVQVRSSATGSASRIALITGASPVYLRVTRSGTTFTAYTSSDGNTWTQIPGSTVTIPMTGAALEGVAVTSHNTSVLSAVTADTLQPS